jgi:hypothetical protein
MVADVFSILTALGFVINVIFVSYFTSRYLNFGIFSKHLQRLALNMHFLSRICWQDENILNFHTSRPVSLVMPNRVCVHVQYPRSHFSKLTSGVCSGAVG